MQGYHETFLSMYNYILHNNDAASCSCTIYQRVGTVLEMATYSHTNLITRVRKVTQSTSSCRGPWGVQPTSLNRDKL